MATPGKELPTLLFTPRAAEGREARTPHAFTQRSPSATSATAGLFHSASQMRDRSPGSATKRRSLTPSGTTPKDTPPPPPSDSLFDIRPATDAPQSTALSTHPATSGTTPSHARGGSGQGIGGSYLQQHDPLELVDTWVTIFGFNQVDLPLVLREFQKCGDVVKFDNFSGGLPVNWIHLQYQTKYGAQRAILKNGEQLNDSIIIGVKPLDQRRRQVLAGQQLDFLSEVPKARPDAVLPVRPYRVATAPTAPVPKADNSVWTKVSEVIFGL
mmetsp:Transcript_32619/g.92486  ORF Transcript_32619/g.92486 Transcript_32619/m.92486 type:complete len:270 (-) Transcript_32619:2348-3157(-)